MSINSAAQFSTKNTLDTSSGPGGQSPMTRMGIQGEAPMTGMKGLGSMGSTSSINIPHHLATRYSTPRPMQSLSMGPKPRAVNPRPMVSGGSGLVISGGASAGVRGTMNLGGGGDLPWRIT